MEQAVTFAFADFELEGRVSVPARAVQAGVVVCHPHPLYGGDMDNNVVTALVEGFRSAGFATLRFNFRGVGASGGMHDDGRGEVEDVKAAVSCLLERCAPPLVAVAGYSFGSIVGLDAGARDVRVHRLVGVALPIARRDASFLHGAGKATLLVSGDRDDISPVGRLRELVANMREPTQLQIVAGADHFLRGAEADVAAAAVAFLGG